MKIKFILKTVLIASLFFPIGVGFTQIQTIKNLNYANTSLSDVISLENNIDLTNTTLINTSNNSKAEVTIGTGTLTNEYYPIYPFYGYSYSQSIYLQSEIGQSGAITKIAYYFNGSSLSSSNNWTIYMGQTMKTSFNSLTDWVSLSNLTQVFSATFTSPSSPGWVIFTLSTPFFYNNIDNLVIAVDENASGYDGSSDRFYNSTVTNNRSMIYYSDTSNPNPASPPSAEYNHAVIPNIKITINSSNPNDVGVISITTPQVGMLPGSISPQIIIKNLGYVAQTNIPVSYKIGHNGIPVTTTVPSLAIGASTNVTFPSWNGTLGSYDFIFYTDLISDGIRSNDTLKRNLKVLTQFTKAFCLKNSTQPASFLVENPLAGFVNIGNVVPWVSRAGVYYKPTPTTYKWFVLGTDKVLYSLDTLSGIASIVGSTGAPDVFLSGLTIDKTTGTLYASGLDGTYPDFTFNLYTVNQSNGVVTLVATSPTTGCFLDIACDIQGQLFAIENRPSLPGRLFSLNKTTAELTPIGTNLGGSISINPQDIEFSDDNILYFTASMGSGSALDGFYTINKSTGVATLISTFPTANTPVVGLGIKSTMGISIPEFDNNNESRITIFPNPIKDYVSIIAKNNETINTINIYKLSGQLVYSENVNHFATTINTSDFNAGFYFIQAKTNKGLFTQKIVITK